MSGSEQRTTTKKDLIQRIADQTSQPKAVVRDVLQCFLEEIIADLARGHRIEFREFGVFETKERAPRRAQNPRTLQQLEVPGRRVVKFKVGSVMRERVEAGPPPPPEVRAAPPPTPQAPQVPQVPQVPPRRPGSPF